MSDSSARLVSEKAAERGEPSYVWRAGQDRRMRMITTWGTEKLHGSVLENGCGVGEYLARISSPARLAVGMDVEFLRLLEAAKKNGNLVCAAGENLPFKSGAFDVVLSNEVLEHVQDDRRAVEESISVLAGDGRFILFCPNRGYPFETHGIYWRGRYRFGNIPLVNYLPRRWRNRLAPHVRAYSRKDVDRLFKGLPVIEVHSTVIFGAYDNIIRRRPLFGRMVRAMLMFLERTPLKVLGLSHFRVMEKQTQ